MHLPTPSLSMETTSSSSSAFLFPFLKKRRRLWMVAFLSTQNSFFFLLFFTFCTFAKKKKIWFLCLLFQKYVFRRSNKKFHLGGHIKWLEGKVQVSRSGGFTVLCSATTMHLLSVFLVLLATVIIPSNGFGCLCCMLVYFSCKKKMQSKALKWSLY